MEEWRCMRDGGVAYKCVWSGGEDGVGGVAVLISSKWQEEVTEVKRVSERIMLVRIRVGKEYCA